MGTGNTKKKTRYKIGLLSVFMLFVFLLPFSVSFEDNGGFSGIAVETNTAHAAVPWAVWLSNQTGDAVTTVVTGIGEDIGRWLGNALMNVGSMFTYFGGMLLEYTIEEFVLGFGLQFAENSGLTAGLGESVENVWELIRDMCNLLFIFGFVYIGVRLIIDSDSSSARRQLASLIIAALLINFSFLITKVVIEFSNILSHTIYSEMFVPSGGNEANLNDNEAGGLAGEIVHLLGVQTWFSPPNTAEQVANLTDGGSIGYYVMGTIFLIITGFVFISGALMLLVRFAALIFIMMFSPLLFAASALPQTAGYAKTLWKQLLSYSFFAPAYLFMILIGIYIIKATVGQTLGRDTFSNVFSGQTSSVGGFTMVVNFALAIAIIYLASTIARKMGLAGGELSIKIAERGKNMVKSAAMKPVRGTVNVAVKGGAKAKDTALRFGSGKLRQFDYSVKGTVAGAAGGSKIGKAVKKLPGVTAAVQKGGMKWKEDMKKRTAELKTKRNSQMKSLMETYMMQTKALNRFQKLEFIAIANAFLEKGDTDELDPHIVKQATDYMKEMGLGTTKWYRLRPDVGATGRFDVDGNHIYKTERDGKIVYEKIAKAGVVLDKDDNVDYKKSDEAVATTEAEFDLAISDIGDRLARTKYGSDMRNLHPRTATSTTKGGGGWAGNRKEQLEEYADSLIQWVNGEMVASIGRNKNNITELFMDTLLEKEGIDGERNAEKIAEYFDKLAKEAGDMVEKGHLKYEDMHQRHRSTATYFRSAAGARLFGLKESPQAKGGDANEAPKNVTGGEGGADDEDEADAEAAEEVAEEEENNG